MNDYCSMRKEDGWARTYCNPMYIPPCLGVCQSTRIPWWVLLQLTFGSSWPCERHDGYKTKNKQKVQTASKRTIDNFTLFPRLRVVHECIVSVVVWTTPRRNCFHYLWHTSINNVFLLNSCWDEPSYPLFMIRNIITFSIVRSGPTSISQWEDGHDHCFWRNYHYYYCIGSLALYNKENNER